MAKQEVDFDLSNPENAAEAGIETSPDEDNLLQVAIGPEEETKPEVVTLTPEDFAALKAQGDSAKAVKEGIEGLAARLNQSSAPQVQPVNAPGPTAEEYLTEHSEELFDREKGPKVFMKGVHMVAEKEYGGIIRGLSMTLANTRKELLESKDPYFKKYKVEVDALVAQQPADVQLKPDIYELAWQSVRQRHQAEIEEDSVSEKVNKAVEAKLKEFGIDPTKSVRPAAHVNSAGRSTPLVTSSGQTKRIARFPDAKTEATLRKEAARRGLDFETLAKTRGYIQ